MPEIVSWKEAKAHMMTRYFTGEPCKNGHVCERMVSSRHCCSCENERRGENREKYNEYRRCLYRENRRETFGNRRATFSPKIEQLYRKAAKRQRERTRKIADLIAVLRKEMPDLLKEFGL